MFVGWFKVHETSITQTTMLLLPKREREKKKANTPTDPPKLDLYENWFLRNRSHSQPREFIRFDEIQFDFQFEKKKKRIYQQVIFAMTLPFST